MSQTKVIIKGKLKLNVEQENRLMLHLQTRRKEVRDEMGYVDIGVYSGWLQKRRDAWAEYENDFLHRETGRYGDLYRLYNSSVNVPKRAIRMFKATACDNLLNTDPFIGMQPEGPEDQSDTIDDVERVFSRKLSQNKVREALQEAVEQAAVSGESVMKVTRKLGKQGKARGRVWLTGGIEVDSPPDIGILPEQPIQDEDGFPITEFDEWEPDPTKIDGPKRLKRAPEIFLPTDARLSEDVRPLARRQLPGELDVSVIAYQDFIISPNAASIKEADYVEHTLEWEEHQVRAYVAGRKLDEQQRVWLQSLHERDKASKKESNAQDENRGENPAQRTGGLPKVIIAESWLRFDLNDDGEHVIEICVFWDVDQVFPIAYDYMEEATTLDDERPFTCIRVIKSKNRWHGMGFYELLSNEHDFIDRQWNRIDYRSGTGGGVRWMREGAIMELEMGIPFDITEPRVWTIAQDIEDPNSAAGQWEFQEMDQNIWQMLIQCMQQAQAMTGTVSPADRETSQANADPTATEITALQAESELMSGDATQALIEGITDTLRGSAHIVFNLLTIEDARLMIGEERAAKLMDWLASNKSKLMYHIKLLMTKMRTKQTIESNKAALSMVVGEVTWMELAMSNPEAAKLVKPLFVSIITALDVPDAESILVIPPPAIPVEGTIIPNEPSTQQPQLQAPVAAAA